MSRAVFYFGGYHASDLDIDAWLRSARAQKPAVEFIGFPWPKGASSGAHSAVKTFSKHGKYASVIGDIQGNGADTIFIVGHSSGCAIANAADAGLKSTEDIVLVALDGFTPNHDQLDRETTQVWGATCDGVNSRNLTRNSSSRPNSCAHIKRTKEAVQSSRQVRPCRCGREPRAQPRAAVGRSRWDEGHPRATAETTSPCRP
jgi:hypothetical protein